MCHVYSEPCIGALRKVAVLALPVLKVGAKAAAQWLLMCLQESIGDLAALRWLSLELCIHLTSLPVFNCSCMSSVCFANMLRRWFSI